MPTSEAPANRNESAGPTDTGTEARPETALAPASPEEESPAAGPAPREAETAAHVISTSRWIDYDTHELLEMISDLEDERRWSRFREGIWLAILLHLAVLSAVTWIPTYVFKVPLVVDKSSIIDPHKDFTYLDTPYLPKAAPKPAPLVKPPVIDKKTLDEMNREAPPAPPKEQEQPQAAPAPVQPKAAAPIPPNPQSQSQLEAPRPAAVPARPNFAMGSQNPLDQMREAMRNSRSRGSGATSNLGGGHLSLHPGAGSGGVQVLSDTQGVDFTAWLQRWHHETERTWDPLIPDEVNPPILKAGMVAIRFKVLPNGRLMEHSVALEGSSGDTALDRAAWGALTNSNYPPLPRDFHGPYLELRAYFLYNMQPR
jgi:TonB family protein